MDARFLNVLHDARDKHVRPVAQAIDVNLHRVRQIAVEQQWVFAQNSVDLAGLVVGIARLHVGGDQARQGVEQVIGQPGLVADDRHRAPAQHIGGAHDERQAKLGGDNARLLNRIGDAVFRLLQAQLVEQALGQDQPLSNYP